MYFTDKEHNRARAQGNLKFFKIPHRIKFFLLFSCFYCLYMFLSQYKYETHYTKLLRQQYLELQPFLGKGKKEHSGSNNMVGWMISEYDKN